MGVARVGINALKVQNAFVRRVEFLAELVDEVCKFHGGRRSKWAFSALSPDIRIWEVSRNCATTGEVGEPDERCDDGFSGYIEVVSGFLNLREPAGMPIGIDSPQLIARRFMCFDCGVRF
jgi:hypothetical protein